MNANTLKRGDVVTLHVANREHRAMYISHDQKAALIDLATVADMGVSNPVVVDWRDMRMWIADRTTDQAFYVTDSDDAVTGDPPERE